MEPGPLRQSRAKIRKSEIESPDLVDEYGEPVSPDNRTNTLRSSRFTNDPLFLIGGLGGAFARRSFSDLRYWLYARSHETTDDAFVDGHIVQVSPKASGYITKVYVADNQNVNAGDLVAELDPRDYQAKLEQTKAALNAGLAQQKQAQTQVTLTRVRTPSRRATGGSWSPTGAFRRSRGARRRFV